MPKIEIRQPNSGDVQKNFYESEIKTMNKGFELSSHKRNSNCQLI